MQGTVAVVVRCFDVVLALDKLHIRLPQQHFLHAVNVVDIAAHDPNAGDVVDVLFRRFQRSRKPLALQLLQYALRRFQAAFDVVDGTAGKFDAEFVVEHLQAHLHFFYRSVIKMLKLQKLLIVPVKNSAVIAEHGILSAQRCMFVHMSPPAIFLFIPVYHNTAAAQEIISPKHAENRKITDSLSENRRKRDWTKS